MTEQKPRRRRGILPHDRQMLSAAYLPVIAFAIVLIGARFSSIGSRRPKAATR